MVTGSAMNDHGVQPEIKEPVVGQDERDWWARPGVGSVALGIVAIAVAWWLGVAGLVAAAVAIHEHRTDRSDEGGLALIGGAISLIALGMGLALE